MLQPSMNAYHSWMCTYVAVCKIDERRRGTAGMYMFVLEYKMRYGISICMQPLTSFIILLIPGFDFFPSLSLSQVPLFLHMYMYKNKLQRVA